MVLRSFYLIIFIPFDFNIVPMSIGESVQVFCSYEGVALFFFMHYSTSFVYVFDIFTLSLSSYCLGNGKTLRRKVKFTTDSVSLLSQCIKNFSQVHVFKP